MTESEIFIIVCWGVVGGLLCGIINSNKGYDPGMGFLVGLFFGPILGTILLLVRKDNKKGLGLRKCPFCAEWIKKEASFCKYCHRDIPPANPPAAQ